MKKSQPEPRDILTIMSRSLDLIVRIPNEPEFGIILV
jgi:hypothetical protein